MNERNFSWAEFAALANEELGRWPSPSFSSQPRFARLATRRSNTARIGSVTRRLSAVKRPLVPGCRRHFPQATCELRRREVISSHHGILKLGLTSRGDHLIQCIPRHLPKTIQRHWLLRSGADPRRCSLPRKMVKNITASSKCAGTLRPGDADRTETVNEHTGFSRTVIHFQPAFDAVVIALLDGSSDETGGSR